MTFYDQEAVALAIHRERAIEYLDKDDTRELLHTRLDKCIDSLRNALLSDRTFPSEGHLSFSVGDKIVTITLTAGNWDKESS